MADHLITHKKENNRELFMSELAPP